MPPKSPIADRAASCCIRLYFWASVCHGNVIRYFVTKVLGMKPSEWTQFSIGQCSLTTVRVSAKGTFTLESYGEVGHIPVSQRTHS
ncbi:MAG: histidine phosphatase family protein [Oligoflexales bacterium]